MPVLEYTYQPSQSLDEVNKQVTVLTEEIKNKLLECASNEVADEISLKAQQLSDTGLQRMAEMQIKVNEQSAKVSLLADYDTAHGEITISAALVNGIEQSDITLSGDQITLNGNTTIGSGFVLSAGHIAAGSIGANEIATGAVTANKIDVEDLLALDATIGGWTITQNGLENSSGSKITQSWSDGSTAELAHGSLKFTWYNSASTIIGASTFVSQSGNNKTIIQPNYIKATGPINTDDGINAGSLYIGGQNPTANISSGGVLHCTKIQMTTPSEAQSTSSPNTKISDDGWVCKIASGSSERFKHDIFNILTDEMDPEKLYNLPVVQFKYNKDYLDNPEDSRYNKPLIGFIAEDVDKIYPQACDYDEEKRPSGWNEHYIIPAMLYLIQEQNKRIEELERRLNG